MAEKVVEVVRASRSGAGSYREVGGEGDGDGKVILISNAGYNRLFRLRLRIPCARGCFHRREQQFRRKARLRVSRCVQATGTRCPSGLAKYMANYVSVSESPY